ncbi:MAG: hypothetical protein U5R31_02325 [Acidimicrobiia bacterium]|nr:hypothetical protein [Acidimicrobiia bacterium]
MAPNGPAPRSDGDGGRRSLALAGGLSAGVLLLAVVFAVGLTRGTESLASGGDPDPTRRPRRGRAPPRRGRRPTRPPRPRRPRRRRPPTAPAEVPELRAFVERERERSFEADVPVLLLEDADFRARVRTQLGGQLERWRYELVRLGLVPEDVDVEALAEELAGQLAGYYDEERIWIRGTELTGRSRTIIVHELAHALDDQAFGLRRRRARRASGRVGVDLRGAEGGFGDRRRARLPGAGPRGQPRPGRVVIRRRAHHRLLRPGAPLRGRAPRRRRQRRARLGVLGGPGDLQGGHGAGPLPRGVRTRAGRASTGRRARRRRGAVRAVPVLGDARTGARPVGGPRPSPPRGRGTGRSPGSRTSRRASPAPGSTPWSPAARRRAGSTCSGSGRRESTTPRSSCWTPERCG